ncbi:MAG: hypothetical protein HY934_01215 [Candidatus Firestonebacteria bacterium]|nr:hypothetical protein [Candidatus Firestonebacteria bacterium]
MYQLKIIPFYTGIQTIEEALHDKKSLDLLWLEILLNDTVDWESFLNKNEINNSYEIACIWYSNFKTIITNYIHRKPLMEKKGKIDDRVYRKFLEALNFVSV